MRRILRNNGLTIVLLVMFSAFLVGQSLTGWHEQMRAAELHGKTIPTLGQYVGSGEFLEATMENWESEFLQMFVYVLFTTFLYQKGSAESKDPDALAPDAALHPSPKSHATGSSSVRTWLYENSLSLVFLSLFVLAFALHLIGGASAYNEDLRAHGLSQVTTLQYLGSARFWFESLQNWQSEFLAIAAMVVFSIFLRQRGSPESKPIDALNSQTGT